MFRHRSMLLVAILFSAVAAMFTLGQPASPTVETAVHAQAEPTWPPPPPSGAQLPALRRLLCSQEPTLRSLNDTTQTYVLFRNRTSRVVRLYWLDYSGHRVYYHTLHPRASWLEGTFATHPWVATRGTKHRCIDIFVATSTYARAPIK